MEKEKTEFWKAREMLEKHGYYMSNKNRVTFFSFSVLIGLVALLAFQMTYDVMMIDTLTSKKTLIIKNIIITIIAVSWLGWLYYHYKNIKKMKKQFDEYDKMNMWYDRYKQYRDGYSKGKTKEVIRITTCENINDTYHQKKRMKIIGVNKSENKREFFIYQDELYPYMMPNMLIQAELRKDIGYNIEIIK